MPRKATTIDAPETPDVDGQLPGVPAGIAADVNIKYKTQVPDPRAAAYRPSVEDYAEELDGPDLEMPSDPLSDWLETWARFVGWSCMVIRLPDPSTRRIAGQTYNRPHFAGPEQLGAIDFDPNPINFINSLQLINGNSGGCFQLWLVNQTGQRIPESILYSVSIGNPRTATTNTTPTPPPIPQYQVPQSPPKSESEKRFEEMKDRLFMTAIERSLNPPAPVSGSNLSPEDQAKLYLLGNTDFLTNIFGKMTELATHAAATNEPKEPTWRDRAIDGAIEVFKSNPAVVERVSTTVERIIARILPDPRHDTQPIPLPVYPDSSQPQPQPQYAPPVEAAFEDTTDPDDEADEDMDILDRLINLLKADTPLTWKNPLLTELLNNYPLKMKYALRMIAASTVTEIVEWIKDNGSELHAGLLDDPRLGPHLHARLAELKALCDAGRASVEQPPTSTSTQPESENID